MIQGKQGALGMTVTTPAFSLLSQKQRHRVCQSTILRLSLVPTSLPLILHVKFVIIGMPSSQSLNEMSDSNSQLKLPTLDVNAQSQSLR
jgi:hypothetical protein